MNELTGSKRVILCFIVLFLAALGTRAFACTSFTLKQNGNLYFAHSLNMGSFESIPGNVFINKRNVWKNGYSWENLQQTDHRTPSLVWKSRYGSVTFSPFGHELPDGGINEAGLFIYEMGFNPTVYPDDPAKPKLFQMQWMQYVLDNFATTNQVIANSYEMSIDGWGWHYFVSDSSGNSAIIDFIDGKPVVYHDDNLPLPLCCNSSYDEAMKFLTQHKGFGGTLEIEQNFEEIPRFIYGAKLLSEFSDHNPVDYAFMMLDRMSTNVRWSVVFDLTNMTAYFKTNINQSVKSFSFSEIDFNNGRLAEMTDIEHADPGDIRNSFIPYDRRRDSQSVQNILQYFFGDSVDIEKLANSIVDRIHVSPDFKGCHIQDEWIGTIEYQTADGAVGAHPFELTIRYGNGVLLGTINDSIHFNDTPLSNLSYEGGLLNFTSFMAGNSELAYFSFYTNGETIKGAMNIWNWEQPVTATIELHRK